MKAAELLRPKEDRSVYLRASKIDWSVYFGRILWGMSRPRPSAKRSDLLATAWKLFYRDGYQRVGIDTLLTEAGVAKKTLYHHFASKDELIVALLEEQAAANLGELDARIARAG